MTAWKRWQPRVGVVLWLLLMLPPARHALEATMTLQMLVQLPLLVLAGWWLVEFLPRRMFEPLAGWNLGGVSGFVLASVVALVWMLPRALDAALDVPWVEAAKFASVPLLVGAPLAISWPRAGFVVRGVFLLEAIAMAFRLGWLYWVSPVRLCSNYLLDDQQRLGQIMLAIGVAACLLVAWQLIAGRVAVGDACQPADHVR